jgi:lysophospholipase L1-like esterase
VHRAPLKIVGLGDSTTAGTPGFRSPVEAPPDGAGNPQSQYAYWMMQLRPEWVVLNRGVNGELSGEILERLPRDVLREAPDYVVFLAGVNDVYRGRSVPSVQSNLSEMYARARAAGIRTVAASILPYSPISRTQASALHELNGWIEANARALGIAFCDLNRITSDPKNPDRLAGSPDGLHPDVTGHRRMADGLVRVIESFEAGRAVE